MSFGFSFHGHTLYRPGILVNSTFGTSRVLQLLPFGTVLFIGQSDGGKSDTLYQFDDVGNADALLRSGAVLDAVHAIADVGGVSQFKVVIPGAKTSASLVLGTNNATLTHGDQGGYTNNAKVTIAAGTSNMAVTFQWPEPDGTITTYGGKGTKFDNLLKYSDLQKAILADPVLTPAASTGFPAKFVLTVTTDANIVALATTYLSGGSGGNYYEATVTLGGTFAVGQGVEATINGTQVTYTETGGDTGNSAATALAAAINANATVGPLVSAYASGAVVTIVSRTAGSAGAYSLTAGTFATAGTTATASAANLAALTLVTQDWKTAIDVVASEPFDIGHLVGCYDAAAQAYFDGQAQTQAPFGRLRRLIHQASVTGASSGNSKQVNSTAVTNSGVSAANALNSYRSSVCVQQLLRQDPRSGANVWTDGAVLAVGLAALKGATGAWGPATPLTYEYVPNVLDVDYPVLDDTGDTGTCIKNGVWIFERVGRAGVPGSVRVVQSVTTQPNDANGNRWSFSEFSVVRVSDALLANVKATVEATSPKAIGAGNTIKTAGAIIAEVVDVLELALEAQWITTYDKTSIQITPSGQSGTQDIVKYSAAPTLPLNNLGIDQTLIPFQVTAAVSGVING